MKRHTIAFFVIAALPTLSQAQVPHPSEEECLGLIAVLPTFQSPGMKTYYEKNPEAKGRQLAEQLHSLADSGDKDAQFTYGMLLSNGYCVPQDICAGKRYREKSRGGANDWEKIYPLSPALQKKAAEAQCS